MLYIFYSTWYESSYQKALQFALQITKNPILINEKIINYNKDNIELFLYYFSLPTTADNPHVIIIEHPENIKDLVIQSFLCLFENIPDNHTIILVTQQLQHLPKTIISRALLILSEEKNQENKKYTQFIEAIKEEKLITQSFEELLDTYHINETNTTDISIILAQKYPELNTQIIYLLKYYLPFIKNSYITYWKIIYILLNKNN